MAREKIVVVHRGLDPARFDPATVDPERLARLRQGWGVTPEQKVILQAARLTSWKGQAVLIEAVALLKANGLLGDAKVILAGDAQGREGYVAELRQHIARHGLEPVVAIVGHVEDIPAAFRAAHVTVVPSTKAEAFGRSVTEAAAMACPVISSDIGAPPETMKAAPKVPLDQATGWLVKVSDPQALADGLAAALALSDDARAAIGQRARTHVLAHFTKRNLQCRTLDVYDRLLRTQLRQRFESAS